MNTIHDDVSIQKTQLQLQSTTSQHDSKNVLSHREQIVQNKKISAKGEIWRGREIKSSIKAKGLSLLLQIRDAGRINYLKQWISQGFRFQSRKQHVWLLYLIQCLVFYRNIRHIPSFGTRMSSRNCAVAIFLIKIMADLVSSRLMI